MAVYIDREVAFDALQKTLDKESYDVNAYMYAEQAIYSVPVADVKPVVRGHWEAGICSECGEHAPYWPMASTYHASAFCPNCGADMREEETK